MKEIHLSRKPNNSFLELLSYIADLTVVINASSQWICLGYRQMHHRGTRWHYEFKRLKVKPNNFHEHCLYKLENLEVKPYG